MDLPAFLFILLPLVCGIAVGVAIYAMSITRIEPRLARGAAWVAWLSLVCIFILYGVVGDMQRGWRYTLAALLSAIATLILCVSIDYVRSKEHSEHTATEPKNVQPDRTNPLTMREIFDSENPGLGKTFMYLHLKTAGKDFGFFVTEYWDIPSNSFFLTFYIEKGQNVVEIITDLVSTMPLVINELGKISFDVKTPGDTRTVSNSTMAFSKQIYFYLDDDLPVLDLARLESIYTSFGYTVHFRMASYRTLHWKEFDRRPVGAGPTKGSGVQLPKADIGAEIQIRNGIDNKPSGSLSLKPELR